MDLFTKVFNSITSLFRERENIRFLIGCNGQKQDFVMDFNEKNDYYLSLRLTFYLIWNQQRSLNSSSRTLICDLSILVHQQSFSLQWNASMASLQIFHYKFVQN